MTAYDPVRLRNAARIYLDAGLSILPIAADTSKAPQWNLLSREYDATLKKDRYTWSPLQRNPVPLEAAERWFQPDKPVGIGIIGGQVSGNLEILDFDNPDRWQEWEAAVAFDGWNEYLDLMPVVSTPSGGRHVYYRVPHARHCRKLAMSPEKDTWIELKGEGGYVLAPPCPPQCHLTGGLYRFMQNGPIKGQRWEIPLMPHFVREALIHCAVRFDETPPEPERTLPPRRDRPKERESNKGSKHSAGDIFNAQPNAVLECLQRHGWKIVGGSARNVKLRRPGKVGPGCSATWNGSVFYVFSANAAPFEANRGYEAFSVYVLVEHNGDWKQAAKTVYTEAEKE